MSTQINRLAAEESIQQLRVITSSQHPDAAVSLQGELNKIIGEPVRFDRAQLALNEKRDEEGFAFLKSI